MYPNLLAILPFYLPFLGLDLQFFRIFRIFRIAKIGRYISVLDLFKRVVKKEKDSLFITSLIMLLTIIFSAVLIHEVQPKVFSMWWAIVSLTTIGYGDIYPVTIAGKAIASCMALAGIAIIAMPTGIISAGFIQEINKSKTKCPYCDKEF
ncbi:potassium channel family protein [Lentisphaerae bacterium WC36]|nr:potassium channel family protein [Lentisphaerae bacterium WC36]